ncbi:ferrochelatase [Neisseria weaveri]|uniref:Ferrochelatase n=1 Tax=Neisseria weaveri TaxID=28091 RepID=A0A3S4YSN9_9NEIS|nr:ferrochelatase [Neisseria weaveri]EGV38136.1 ferrochelatase [Neisseria weaveri LMG 5135]SAY50343.1 ferrochelatase [Neisseria weaveri]VEJ51751.1 ferrochelatase [Neisseria weaveri]
MSPFQPEPVFQTGHTNKTAVLLINLGSPEAPTAEAVRPYLKEFLSDQRVVELPKWLWQPILRGFILPFRPKQSAHGYEKIWFEDGSPLTTYTQRQAGKLSEKLPDIEVAYAMTYGKPSIADTLNKLKIKGVNQVLVIPLYPQYAASSSAAALDKVFQALQQQRNQISVRTVSRFYDDPGYIEAMRQHISAYWAEHGRSKKLMLSFHGVPQACCDKGDPYQKECLTTGRLLAEALGLSEYEYTVAFQSQFGKAKWIGPSTQTLLDKLPMQGETELDIFCPGFVSDCLETMEEIAIAGREQFYAAGGTRFQYIPCLNDNEEWIHALSGLAQKNLQGW